MSNDIEVKDGKPTLRKPRSKSVDGDLATVASISSKKAESMVSTPKSVQITKVDF